MLWRGVPAGIDESLFWWEAPDGTRLFTVYLMHGYGNAVHLPAGAGRAGASGCAARPIAWPRARASRRLLLMNGSDHVEPQPGLPAALEAALARLPGTQRGDRDAAGLSGARAARGSGAISRCTAASCASGLRSPLLEGCASARMPLKRADFLNDRLLTRYLEPLAAWLAALGGDADPAFLDLAWRIALENHPHDSICGCSIDAVHDQMEARFARVADIAQRAAAAGDRGARARGRGARGRLRARRRARARGLEPARVRAGRGGGRARARPRRAAPRAPPARRGGPPDPRRRRAGRAGRGRRQPTRWRPAASRSWRAGFRTSSWGCSCAGSRGRAGRAGARSRSRWAPRSRAASTWRPHAPSCSPGWRRPEKSAVTFRALRLPRYRLRFVDALPGCGLRVYRVARGPARLDPALRAERLPGGGAAIENQQVRLEASGDGQPAPARPAQRRARRRRAAAGERGRPRRRVQLRSGARRRARGEAGACAREARTRLGGRGLAADRCALPGARRARAGPRARARRERSGCRSGSSSGSRAGCHGWRSSSSWTTRRGITAFARTCGLPSPPGASRWNRPSKSPPARSRRSGPASGASIRRSSRSGPRPSAASPRWRRDRARSRWPAAAARRWRRCRRPRARPRWRSRCCARSAGSRAAISRCARSTPARRSRHPAPRESGRTAWSSPSGCTRTATRSAAPTPTASARRPGSSPPRATRTRRCATARGCSRSTIPRWWSPRSSRAPRARR